MDQPLRLLGGRSAIELIRERGLGPEHIALLAGAAGGPKWLILKGLDDWIFGHWLAEPPSAIDLVGASIGAWRFAAVIGGRADAFFEAYLAQRYSSRPTPAEVSRVARQILAAVFDAASLEAVVEHRRLHLAILAVRCRGPLTSEARAALGMGLAGAAALNVLGGRLVGLGFARHAVVHRDFDQRWLERPAWGATASPLTAESLGPALLASGSIPLVLEGVRDLPGAPAGMYRDGGITDYHVPLAFRRTPSDKLVLFPHFSSTFKPGWFDKHLAWRRLHPADRDRTLAVVPSPELVASLPGGRIPDRHDFYRLDDATRIGAWRRAVDASRRLGEAFAAWVEAGAPADRIEPW